MRVPLVLQADQTECGLACVAMVAAYHGHQETLRAYRAKFRISQQGTTLHSLRSYAERLGFKCRPLRIELDELKLLRRPAILHWDLDHFVVLAAVGRKRVKVIDPAVGARSLGLAEVSEHFTGVAMELAPTPALKPARSDAALPFGAFIPAFRGLGGSLGAVCGMMLALQAFALVMPLNLQFTIDQGVRQGDMNIVTALGVGFGIVGLIAAATEWLRTLVVQYVGNTSAFRITAGLAHHLLRLRDEWLSARHTGDVISRFASTEPVGRFLMTGAFEMLVNALMAVGALAILLIYSWELTVALCAFSATFGALRFATLRRLRNLTHEAIAANAHEDSSFIENVERHRAIKLLGAERLREDAWGTHYVQALNADFRLARFGAHVAFGGASLAALQTVALLVLGAGKVVDGTLTLGMLLAFSSYANLFSSKAQAVIESLVELGMLRLHRERIADIALEEREARPDSASVCIDLQGRVEARSLSFSYGDHGPSVLNDFSLLVSPGEFVAIAGRSGVGKSTLVKLICKLLTPESGVLFIDGTDINSLDPEHYRGQLGVVMQDDDLFSGSLIENIAMSEGQADLERVRQAAALACIHDDIERMPMGYHTLVGPMGSTLSGGQRQRVMIARALYRRPALILMDESTAHLDEDLQRQVFDNLMATGTTIIAVTHDERVLTRADRQIRLGDGSTSPQNG
ncbi:MAG: peptidase domain-containing ABC transporter [Gammaproteobacteria bacterium]|nr:peptidase domain-containing ABC transporter [Gammaproteobacteria bacterium]